MRLFFLTLLLFYTTNFSFSQEEKLVKQKELSAEEFQKTQDALIKRNSELLSYYDSIIKRDSEIGDSLNLEKIRIDSLITQLKEEQLKMTLRQEEMDRIRKENEVLKQIMSNYSHNLDSLASANNRLEQSTLVYENRVSAVAKDFLDNYIQVLENAQSTDEVRRWLYANDKITNQFKESLKELIRQKEEEDPIMGLDFDPVLEAQDYPSSKFELKELDHRTGIMSMVAMDDVLFIVRVKVNIENGTWKVDGSGAINMTE